MPEPEPRQQIVPEVLRSSSPRDVAVDYAGYFGVYLVGRAEYDRATDRIPALDRMADAHPAFADKIKLLDAHLERANEARKGFFTGRTPVEDSQEVLGSWDVESRKKRVAIVDIPPDYSFASVRHPLARSLLDLVNVAVSVDDQVLDDRTERSRRLAVNGKKITETLLGKDPDPHALLRITDVDVLTAIFEGRLGLPASPGMPITEWGSIQKEDLVGELDRVDH